MSPLQWAAFRGNMEIADFLLKHEYGAEVRFPDENGWTALHFACKEGHLEIVKLLINHGAMLSRPTNNWQTPLDLARKENHMDVAWFLVRQYPWLVLEPHPFLRSDQLLIREVRDNTVQNRLRVLELLREGANINARGDFQWTPLMEACITNPFNNTEMIKLLVENGADVNARASDGDTALKMLCGNDNWKEAQLLIDHGARVNDWEDVDGHSPLHRACMLGQVKVAKLLIENNAKVNAIDKHRDRKTPLHISCCDKYWGNVEVVKLLIDHGADIDAKEANGETALHLACRRGRVKIVEFLLTRGASLKAKSDKGCTPLDVACQENQADVVWFLVRQGLVLDPAE